MALQDLTPQLRTRLSRMERAVGWFVILATALLVFGFGYYFYKTTERKGWYQKKIYYETCVSSGAGLGVSAPVKLMGFDVGEITAIIPNSPDAYFTYAVTIRFYVKVNEYNYPGYIWSDSKVKNVGDLFGHQYLEIVKGIEGVPTVRQSTNGEPVGLLLNKPFKAKFEELQNNKKDQSTSQIIAAFKGEADVKPDLYYTNQFRGNFYFLEPEPSAPLTERLEKVASQVEAALPNILNLTNQLAGTLANAMTLTSNLNIVAVGAQPIISNLSLVTAHLDHPGALGEWLLPTNVNEKLDLTLANANTNLESLNVTILNLADLTSNLNYQVQVNSNILSQLSTAVRDTDDLVQGLKRHWLLRSAFKKESTNAPPSKAAKPILSPKQH